MRGAGGDECDAGAAAAAAECDAGAAAVEPVAMAMSRAQVERQLLLGSKEEQFQALRALQALSENSAAARDWMSSPAAAGVEDAVDEDTAQLLAAVTIIKNLKNELDGLAAEKEALARNCELHESIQEEMVANREVMQKTLQKKQEEVDGLTRTCELSEQRVDRAKAVARDGLADLKRVKANAERDIAAARREKLTTKNKLKQVQEQNEQLKVELQEAQVLIKSTYNAVDDERKKKVAAEKVSYTAQANADKEIDRITKKMDALTNQIARMDDAEKHATEDRRQLKADVKAEQRKTAVAQEKTAEAEHALEKKQQEIDALKERRPTAPYPTAPSGSECVICMARSPTFAHVKCGHLIYCDTCATEMNEKKDCPVCRQQFVQKEVHHLVKIYD